MVKPEGRLLFTGKYHIRFMLLALVAFWLADAAVDSIFFSQGNFFQTALRPDHYEQYFRILVSLLLVLSILAWASARRHKDGNNLDLAKSEERYRILVETAPDGILIHRDNRILFANQKCLTFFGAASVADLARSQVEDIVQPAYRPLVRERLVAVFKTGEISPLAEIGVILLDGTPREVEVSTTLIDFEGAPALLTFFRDISDMVKTRQDLQDSRDRLQLALEAAQDGAWDWDIPTGKMVYSKIWAAMLGYELSEIDDANSTWHSLVHPEDRDRALSLVSSHFRGETPAYEVELRLRHKDGHYLWVLDRGRVAERDEQGNPVRMVGTHRNITERKTAQLALEVRNRIAEAILTGGGIRAYADVLRIIKHETGSPAGFLGTLNDNGDLQLCHPKLAETRPGQTAEFRQILSADNLPPLLAQVIGEARSLRGSEPLELENLGSSFQPWLAVPITNQSQVMGLVVVADRPGGYADAEQTLLESLMSFMAPIMQSHLTNESKELQLQQAQKMEALGALAGGIAHDFNNILQAILGFTTLAHEDVPADSQTANDLERVLKATRRGQNLVQQILLFSRREEQKRQPLEMSLVLGKVVDLLEPSLPSTIEIRTELPAGEARVFGDPSQINQAILNLATNAYHAMEYDGGVLSITLGLSRAGSHPLDFPAFFMDRDLVVVTVSDTGQGITPADMRRLFDPFFTTKEVGRGTGLGLSIVHGIITAHGGEIVVDSEVGRGTTVKLLLPVFSGQQESVETAPESPRTARSGNHHRILFVDDEQDIADLGQAMLEKSGVSVTIATNSQAALDRVRNDPGHFDLVITDLTMPRINGLQLAAECNLIAPDLPVLLITGMTDGTVDISAAGSPNIKGIIRKPFTSETLQQHVEGILTDAGEEDQVQP